MECRNCKSPVSPGLEITIDPLQPDLVHCPYCLDVVDPQARDHNDQESSKRRGISVKRFTKRQEVRERYVDDLRRESRDDTLHCPVCDHALSKADELIFSKSEHFRCHLCCHDLATLAYRKDAYAERRWLPVVYALGDLRGKEECTNCRYLGAMAKACQSALSWMPKAKANHGRLLAALLRPKTWKQPACEWRECFAARQYQTLAGAGLVVI